MDTVKAVYSIDDIELVDRRDLESANEARFYAELFLSVAIGFAGNLVSNFNIPFLITVITFGLVGIYMAKKSHDKSKKVIKKANSSEIPDKNVNSRVLNLLYSENGLTVNEVMSRLSIEYAIAKITLRGLVSARLAKYKTDASGITRYFCYEKEDEFNQAHPEQEVSLRDMPF